MQSPYESLKRFTLSYFNIIILLLANQLKGNQSEKKCPNILWLNNIRMKLSTDKTGFNLILCI